MNDEFTFPVAVVAPHITQVCDAMIQFGDTINNIVGGNGEFGEEFILDSIAAGDAIAQLLNTCNEYMETVGPIYMAFKAFFDGLHGGDSDADSLD